MLGTAHSATALAAGALTLPLAPVHDVPSQLAWVMVVGGCGYLPDMDQSGSTPGRTWGPVTGVMARVVSFAGRGHRGGSHDPILAPLAAAVLFAAAASNHWTAVVAVALAAALALHALDTLLPGDQKPRPFYSALLSFTWAAWMVTAGSDFLWWLPWAAALGVVVHIVGDWLTVDGIPVPLTWLTRKRTFGARLFRAGSPIEKPITWVSLVLCVAGVAWFSLWPYLSRFVLGA